MTYTYYTADVFTETAFQGAQIAVFPNAQDIGDEQMALIAREINLSETVFVSNTEQDSHFKLRIFTPLKEVSFAGHPVLATAKALVEEGMIGLTDGKASACFQQKAGDLSVNLEQREGETLFVQFSLSSDPVIDRYTPRASELAALLSIDESDIDTHTFQTRLVSINLPYLILPLASQAAVRKARFDMKAWSQSSAPAMAAQEILVFSNHTDNSDTDFHARLLGPSIGIHEDPPIGSAMPCFTGYLGSHDAIREGTYTFIIDRGTAATRRSVLAIEMDNHADKATALRVGGNVVLVSKNTLLLS
ncbi:MAG: PhzF family phenazine biosynthesis protein [Porticoccaceae bacterium]|nr:PhzF family phenazine biosynthesis protein [Porticoccaceae bacterium]